MLLTWYGLLMMVCCVVSDKARKPHVILIVADDLVSSKDLDWINYLGKFVGFWRRRVSGK